MGGTYSIYGNGTECIQYSCEKIAFGKPRRRKEENVKMTLKEIGCEIMQ
jgi:hypothetical protein